MVCKNCNKFMKCLTVENDGLYMTAYHECKECGAKGGEVTYLGKVLALDPGETTGWFYRDFATGEMQGGTVPKDHQRVVDLIMDLKPDLIIYETFHLYPGKAQSLAWNSFYPCEVIGVIKLIATGLKCELVAQAPSVKKYAGGLQADWVHFQHNDLKEKVTEHVKDAYLHLKYWERNALRVK